TNVQEAGVDEPDVVKTDGDRVVAVTGGVLRVLDAGSAAVLGSLDLRAYAGASNAQLFVSGDAALVLLDDSGSGMYGSSGAGVATFLFVDLTGAPRVTGSLSADGDYLDARMVGTVARVVAQSSPVINFPPRADNEKDSTAKANNQKAIREAPIDAWLPSYTVTVGADSAPQRVPCGSVNLPDEFTGASLQTVYTIDLAKLGDPDYLADPAAAVAPVSVAADGDTVYADAQSLYIASNPSWYDDGPNPGKTELHRFAISGAAAPLYLGSGAVPGRLLSSYSLSEYDGYLRIVTTSDGTSSNRAQSDLYVLNAATLDRVGHVGGLGRGQRLYAVRFTGPRGYVVTFRQTDPLYVLDLSDPRAPKLAGELHITGYSDYLYDAGDNRLIGVGQEADRDGRATGMQVSLFDVSDPAAPKRAAQVTLPGAIGWGQLNPHAFLCWQPTGLVVAPVDTWSGEQSGKVLALRLQGLTLTKLGLVANPLGSALRDDGQGIQRSLLVAGQLWTLSGSGVRISDPGTLAQLAWSPFS
ncbi:MAG: beta-propeller domain-containing protein, partial [Actinomycetia bacterium]|nr:beta-propeller domain-containing protein [Actinomycetes bacterium]